ncbi:hypothetical protein MSI_01450 [Treponema sp. JC4]|uniref:hypothetical protein n=1 Tax=Treponema sp. JC4 TaxID=1124982 RepID=UPI00025B094A|nr:hypothetical protein [Treponema sp. JC4]EID86189.1 hypothetical protein MSI_01450 [Treponema sp. JC4]
MKKGKIAKRTIAFFILQFFLFCFYAPSLFAGEMIKPRIIYQLKTKYFNILYSKESTETAKLLAQKADALYENAAELLSADKNYETPIVITPDSDLLSVTYTAYPYNRIVVKEGLPSTAGKTYEDELLTLFNSQIFKATAASIKSPFNKVLSNFMTWWQPVEVLNLPFSALDGVSYLDQILTGKGEYNDGYFLQVLSQAKVEGNFPSWLQAGAASNAYSDTHLAVAANSAFAAYLIGTYGIEKYSDFLHECGKIKFPRLTKGIFKKVYNKKLDDEWNVFKEMIPLPEKLLVEETEGGLSLIQRIFSTSDGTYKNLLSTPYGFVYYDSIKNEVLLAKEYKNPIKNRPELFKYHLLFAKDVTKLDLSPDGRYLLICCNETYYRENFVLPNVRFYDLKRHCLLTGKFRLRDAAFVAGTDKQLYVAGINSSDKKAALEVYDFESRKKGQKKKVPLYKKVFAPDVSLESLSFCGPDNFICLLGQGEEISLLKINISDLETEIEDKESLYYLLNDKDKAFKPKNLRFSAGAAPENQKLTFEFVDPQAHSFTRLGIIELNEAFEPVSLKLQQNDISGGLQSPAISDHLIYFSRSFTDHDEIAYINLPFIEFTEGKIIKKNPLPELDTFDQPAPVTLEELRISFPHTRYYPLKYASAGAMYPFFPIASFDYKNDVVLWPGLGISYTTNSDPYDNTTIMASVSFGLSQYGIEDLGKNFVDEVDRIIQNFKKFKNDISFGTLIKNTSTPLDLSFGSIFNFSSSGTYAWKSLAGASFKLPFILNMNALEFNFKLQYIASSMYLGFDESKVHPDLTHWPSLSAAYHFTEIYANVNYSNIHQDGNSLFEKFGFAGGITTIADFESIFDRVSRYTVGFDSSVAIPRLLPFDDYQGLVFCLPAEAFCEAFVTEGTAFKVGGQLLLLGKEIKNGLYPVFISRTGIYAGYSFNLNYDTKTQQQPDIRNLSNYWDTFNRAEKVDDIYLKVILDIVPVIGTLSNQNMRTELQLSYLPRINNFKLYVGIYMNFD